MARYIENLNECTDPTTGDFLLVTDASAGSTDKDRKVNISRFAILANAQTFTARQTFTPPASTEAIYITPPTNHNANTIYFNDYDNGSSFGTTIRIGRNSNVSTPAAGFLSLVARGGTTYYLWTDNTGVARVGTTLPTNAQDTSGTVIGAQTSYADLKEGITPWDGAGALDAVLSLPLHSYRFKEDDSARQYHGIVINDSDRGAWFSENDGDNQTPSLNERNLFGYLVAAIQGLQAQINDLKSKQG